MHANYGKVSKLAFAGAAVVCVATMTAMLPFAEPNGDDFCLAPLLPLVPIPNWEQASGYVAYAIDTWKYFCGRWLTFLALSPLLNFADMTTYYPVLVGGTWLVFCSGLAIVARTLLAEASRGLALITALGLLMIFWSRQPGPGDGFFWFVGAFQYIAPLALGAGLITMLTRRIEFRGRLSAGVAIAAAILAFAIAGTHELQGIYIAGALTVGAVATFRARSRVWPVWAACLVAAVLGVAVSAGAPGNFIRAGLYPESTLRTGARSALMILTNEGSLWVLDLPLLAGTLAFVFDHRVRAIRGEWVHRFFPGFWRWIVPAMTAAIVIVGISVPSYGTSGFVQGRTLNSVYMAFLVGWLTTVFVFTRGWLTLEAAPRLSRGLGAASLIVFSLAVVLQGNTRVGLSDLLNNVRPWHAAIHSRYDQLRAAAGTDETVVVEYPGPRPRLFFDADILHSVDGWRNICVARYFGVAAVELARPIS